MNYSVVILAAGKGSRTGLKYNKILHKIHSKSVINYSIDFFTKDEECSQILLVVNDKDFSQFSSLKNHKISNIIIGGNTRQKSVYNSLKHITEKYVIIHDGARPFIPPKSFQILKKEITSHSSITLGLKVTNTIQRIHHDFVVSTIDRSDLIETQTPQGFHTDKLKQAHKLAQEQDIVSTDDTTLLLELLNIQPFVVEGHKNNIKFTGIEDLPFLEVIL